ncbi:hypothetical protein GGR50DRAFT_41877 [Xylaria sp. CBS 124048]|nr:hypothetical protein GGR50DRAFT_41877 [Xylaria sp. CBS 124048]
MTGCFSQPSFWLEFKVLSDGLETNKVLSLPLTKWHAKNNRVFRLFPELPMELRLKVWEYLVAPRVVGIACLCLEDGGTPVELQRHEIWGPRAFSAHPVPVLLHVNRETRELALKHYELSFEWNVPRVLTGAGLPSPAPPALVTAVTPASTPIRSRPATASASSSTATQSDSAFPQTSRPTNISPSHMSSYHDLLDPLPHSSHFSPSLAVANETEPSGTSQTNNPASTSTPTADNGPTHSLRRPASSPPRTWFNFDLDAVYLPGELEPCDSFGFNSPMTYFISSQTARRVRKTAVSFRALRFGEAGSQQIFGALFHVADRFAPVDGEILVCVAELDEWTHGMIGSDTPLLSESYWAGMQRFSEGSDEDGGHIPHHQDNVVQEIWRDWYRGSIVTSPLARLRFSLIALDHLEEHVYDAMVTRSANSKNADSKAARMVGRNRAVHSVD